MTRSTDKDYASKEWLNLRATEDDPFVKISPDLAIVAFCFFMALGYVLGRVT